MPPVQYCSNVNDRIGHVTFLKDFFTNSRVAPLDEFHLQMLSRVAKKWQSARFVTQKIDESWHETVVLAGLGQFCEELVEGSIPSTIIWNRAAGGLTETKFDNKKATALPTVALAGSQNFSCCLISYCQDILCLDI